MSWFQFAQNTSQNPNHPNFSAAAARNRQAKLEADRLQRLQARHLRQKQLQSIRESQQIEDQAIEDLLSIAIDIFEDDIMPNFDEQNTQNGDDAMKNLGQIKVKWNPDEPKFFFQSLETELQIFSINKQFTKRQALVRNIPEEMALEFKHLVTLQETEAGNLAYKNLKNSIRRAYGPRPEAAFQRALNRVMVGKPSVLLKQLISDICPSNLIDCTLCPATIWGLFQLQIPLYLKNSLANEVFNATTMQNVMDRADNTWAVNQSDKQVSAVTASAAANAVSTPVSAAENSEIAAVSRGRGNSGFRGNRGFRQNRGGRGYGRGRGGQNNGPDPRGKRHESNPPWNSCGAHWVYFDKAWKCQSPMTCPLKDKVTPKSTSTSA